RCHDNEIAPSVRGRCNDGLIGLLVVHLNRVAGQTSLLGRMGHADQYARSMRLDLLGMFGEFPQSLLRLRFWTTELLERRLDNNQGYLGSHGFRQRQSIRSRMLRYLRPICWDENMLVHSTSPLSERATKICLPNVSLGAC